MCEKTGTNAHKYGLKSHRSVTIIVLSVVCICIVCNVTAMTSHLLWSLEECYKQRLDYLGGYRQYFSLVGNVMVTFNSAVNFVVYCVFSRNFRAALVCMCRCQKHVTRRVMTSQGRWSHSLSSVRTHGGSTVNNGN